MTRPLIIGGGLAGGAAALRLAARGTPPLLLERETGPHDKICGEFVSIEAARHLAALGFDLDRLGGAPIDTVRLHAGRRSAVARLPFRATGLSRRVLDAALLDAAAAAGAEVRRGVTVRRLEHGRAHTALGEVEAGPVLLATGKHELRGAARDPAGTIADLIGFKMFFRSATLARRLAGAVEITAFDGGYAGLQPVEGARLNLCLLVSGDRYKAIGGSWRALFNELLREPGLAPLADAIPLLDRPLAISAVPYGYLAPPSGLWRLGDQAAVIPSFCGDGMAMALHGGRLAADMLAAGATPQDFQTRLRGDVARQVRLATTLQRLASGRLGRFALVAGLGAAPGLLAKLAAWTRVEPAALARAGA